MNKSPIVNITIKKKMFSVAYAVVTGENEVKSAKKLLALYRDRIKQRIIGKDTMKEYNYLLSIYPLMVSEYKKALKLEKRFLKSNYSKIYNDLKGEAFFSYMIHSQIPKERVFDHGNWNKTLFAEEMRIHDNVMKKIHRI